MIELHFYDKQCAGVIFTDPRDNFETLYVEFKDDRLAQIFAGILSMSEQFKGEEIKVENK